MEVIIMKSFSSILKIIAVLAAIVGIVYVAAVYGERIVAWARSVLKKFRGEKFYCYDDDFYANSVEANEVDFQA